MKFDTVAEIIANVFGMNRQDITEQTDILEDLNASSMDIVELIVAVEHETGLHIPDEIVDTVRTAGDAFRYLLEHMEHA